MFFYQKRVRNADHASIDRFARLMWVNRVDLEAGGAAASWTMLIKSASDVWPRSACRR